MILLKEKIGQDKARQCDSRCVNAKGGNCGCICGGRNHGVGMEKAMQNVREIFGQLIYCEHNKLIGTCPEGCYKPKGQIGQIQVPRKALREMQRREEMAASA